VYSVICGIIFADLFRFLTVDVVVDVVGDMEGDCVGGWSGIMVGYHVVVGKCPMRAQEPNFKNKKSGSAKSGGSPLDLSMKHNPLKNMNHLQILQTTTHTHTHTHKHTYI
jgi:hypothetical protein